jgi:hypothetical protein
MSFFIRTNESIRRTGVVTQMSVHFPTILPMHIDLDYCHQRWIVIDIENERTNTDTILQILNSNGLVACQEEGPIDNYNEVVCQVELERAPLQPPSLQSPPSLLLSTPNRDKGITLQLNMECYQIYNDSKRFLACLRNKSRVQLSTLDLDKAYSRIQETFGGDTIDPQSFVPTMKPHTVVFE